jgi:ABC-type multidrug transport system fused ATPase/permease subunit
VADVIWFLDLKPQLDIFKGKLFTPKISSGIIFKDVWFKYSNSENWIIKGASFNINPKDNVALVGENGAGKTTLVKLLCGFYSPTKGEILLNGININKYSLKSYWKQLSVLFQDFEDYDFSARESIGYGNVDMINNLKEIIKYAKMADIHEWIDSLSLKYETPLSRWYTKGVTPSGGQRQRIGIARTLIKNGKIIVLDEPTSNVDPQAEEDIFNEVLKLGKNKILIFISHRFSTVRRADKILLLENGTISEQGSHDELMKKNGKYAHLFNLQAKSYQ